jgi:hypothetical protein
MKTTKRENGRKIFQLRSSLATMALAGAAVLMPVGAEAALKYKKSCQEMLSVAQVRMIDDAAQILGDNLDEIIDYANSDPWESGYRSFSSDMREDLRSEVQKLRDGKIPLRCFEPNERGKCAEGAGTSTGAQTVGVGSLQHFLGYDSVVLCPQNNTYLNNESKEGLAAILAHELTHHVDPEGHRGFCTENIAATLDEIMDGARPFQSVDMKDAEGRFFRCESNKKKDIKAQCPASVHSVSCENIGITMSPNDVVHMDGAEPNAAETIGFATNAYLGRADIQVQFLSSFVWEVDDGEFEVRIGLEVSNDSASHLADSLNFTVYSGDDFVLSEHNATIDLWPGESRLVTLHAYLNADEGELVALRIEEIGGRPDLYPDDNTVFSRIFLGDEVQLPIVPLNAIVDATVTGKSGVECGVSPGSPGLTSSDLAHLGAEAQVDARMANRCFGGDKPSDLNWFGQQLSSATNWDDYCAETCEAYFPEEVIVSGSAKVIDKAVSELWKTQTPNACGAGSGLSFQNSKGGSASYSAYQTRLEGTGTCGCSCELG